MSVCGQDEKSELRRTVRERLKLYDSGEFEEKSAAACLYAAVLPEFLRARTILSYMPMRTECSTQPLMRAARRMGKRIAFPLCADGKHLDLYAPIGEDGFAPGRYGILEPVPERSIPVEPSEIDFAIVPGVAFDKNGNRLGHGAGYYDRLLPHVAGIKLGMAFDFQMFDVIAADGHDVRMDYVVTNHGLIVNNLRSAL